MKTRLIHFLVGLPLRLSPPVSATPVCRQVKGCSSAGLSSFSFVDFFKITLNNVEDLGVLYKDPGVLLKDLGVLLKDPGIFLKDPGVPLKDSRVLLKDTEGL